MVIGIRLFRDNQKANLVMKNKARFQYVSTASTEYGKYMSVNGKYN